MPRRKDLQTNFSSGELSPDIDSREDTEQYKNGARSLRNRRCKIGGGTCRRPGSWHMVERTAAGRAEPFVVDEATGYVLLFEAGKVLAYLRDPVTGQLTASGSVLVCPWTGTIFQEMDYTQSGNTAFLTHPTMGIYVLLRTGPSSWSLNAFAFFANGPRLHQPYYKVADDAVTLQPSALTGAGITLTASAAHFVAGHVGQRVRYLGREILITAIGGGGTTATATVIEKLPGTYTLTVTSSADFTVGESVAGITTGAKAIVASIPDATHLVVYLSGSLIQFSGTEDIAGPHTKTTISAVVAATPAAIKEWEEALFNAVNGYPRCCVLHRNRILFGGHPVVPNGLIGSRLNNLYSFDVDDQTDADAIFETIGDAGASEILQMHSSEQLLILTDRGPYYIPESAANPFRAQSIAFFPFGSAWPFTATVEPRAFDNGVLMISGSLVIKARPTGDVNRSWDGDEVSLLSSHIVSNPKRLISTSNFAGGAERYALAFNDDGTLAVMQLIEIQKVRNMTPWDTNGIYTSGASIDKHVYVTTERTVNGQLRYYLELFDQSITLDCATSYADEAAMDAGVPTRYGETPVNIVVDARYHLGEYPLEVSNPPDGPYVVGLFYDSEIETMPPSIDDDEGSHTGELMRIVQSFIKVKDSQRFSANGRTLSAYQVTDNLDEPPPRRSGPLQFDFLGWDLEPTVKMNQPDPLPLEVQSIKNVVAF